MSLFIYFADNRLMCCGNNRYGQLGLDINNFDVLKPTLLMADKDILDIATSRSCSAILTRSGEVYVFGANSNGHLGCSNALKKYISLPKLLMIDPKIKLVSCNENDVMLYRTDGKLLSFGRDNNGFINSERSENKTKPIIFMANTKIIDIVCDVYRTIIFKENGELIVLGGNSKIVKNITDRTILKLDNVKKFSSVYECLLVLKNNGDLIFFEECDHYNNSKYFRQLKGNHNSGYEQTLILTDPKISQISCGSANIMIYKNNGELYIADHRQLPDNIELELSMKDTGIKKILHGIYYAAIYKYNGELYTFGENEYGQLGFGDRLPRNKPTLLMTDENILMINNVRVGYKWSTAEYADYPKDLQKIIFTLMCIFSRYRKQHNIYMVPYMRSEIFSRLVKSFPV